MTTQIHTKKIGTLTLAFMVLAMAAPVGVAVALLPLVIAYGNGVGAPGMFLVVAGILLIFTVGFSAMSRAISARGAFLAYIGAGLGKRAGTAAGFVALGSYTILMVYVTAQVGYFFRNFLLGFGIDVNWVVLALAVFVVVATLGIVGTRESAIVTAVLLTAEILILLVVNVGVLITAGPSAYPWESFSIGTIFSGSPGFALALVFLAFIGYEATAVFRDHVKDPKRTVGRATVLAVVLIGILYAFTAWSVIAGVGTSAVVALAQGPDAGTLLIDVAATHSGVWSSLILQVVFLTSVLATMIGCFNTASHYLSNVASVLGAKRLGARHPRRHTPVNAAIVISAITVLAIGGTAVMGLDPYAQVSALLGALGAVGVIALQVACAAAIFVYFRRTHDSRVWTTIVSPVIAFLALSISLTFVLINYSAISGASVSLAEWSPVIFAILAIVGWAVGGKSVHPHSLPELGDLASSGAA